MSKILDEKVDKMSNKERDLLALRHTAEHVLHTALQNLYPSLKKAMGPATADGFYHDFDLDIPVNEADFPKIEAEMKRIIDLNLPMVQKNISSKEAREKFNNNPYKLEWIDEIEKRGEEISTFQMGDEDLDICSGPHAKSTGDVKAFKLLSLAGAYWHGSEKNKMLQRIYGTAFPSAEELEQHLINLEEAKARDHRIIGKNLDLFVFADIVGKGLPLFTPKGSVIRRVLERFIVDEEIKRGYDHVYTPELARTELYKTSGHYPYYKDTMYPVMKIDDEELILRPMTCPHHFQLYLSKPRTYKELPVRFAELAKQFRYEKSGELSGLMRVRSFCLADAHIICRPDQAPSEINGALDLIEYIAGVLGLKKGEDYRYRLSKGDRTNDKKYYKDDNAWDHAEEVLRQVLVSREAPYFEADNEAAFYGPKIDIQMKNIAGMENTAFTVQYDFVLPKRFELNYIDNESQKKEAIVVHRSSIGAFERVMAFLIEKYAGAFPFWLCPVQVNIIPISDRHMEYANSIKSLLEKAEIRVEIDDRAETMQAKIRDAQLQKVPYMLIVGDREVENKTISIRKRSGESQNGANLDEFLKNAKEAVATRSLTW